MIQEPRLMYSAQEGRSALARATETLEEETSTAGNHQFIGSYVEMLGRKRKRETEV
ncbi:hypothetical protein AYI69_g8700, partial [Smittium culicis]